MNYLSIDIISSFFSSQITIFFQNEIRNKLIVTLSLSHKLIIKALCLLLFMARAIANCSSQEILFTYTRVFFLIN